MSIVKKTADAVPNSGAATVIVVHSPTDNMSEGIITLYTGDVVEAMKEVLKDFAPSIPFNDNLQDLAWEIEGYYRNIEEHVLISALPA